ncbi:MAG: exopolyphosphatase [Alteromonadaceae bacterium]|uniref:Exopolyphosphatase n=1 Tax=Hydrocarboniclastica marina TaxID=2259620 RepID=A0A4P7XK39_9ALTE|nr:exopolyphosphatase [Alteromonadaceae bacterium]QCF27378.1 exopolyphosphatase [Hydrocarboniclastica marina]
MAAHQSVNSPSELIAAIDLGSNSFHMVVARLVQGEIRTLEKMGEKVQLAAGLDSRNNLSEEAQLRGLECLGRFAQRIRGMDRGTVQAVGTNALRAARNARQFIHRAEEVLGVPVEIIAGREEARLIYLGASHTLADDVGRRLVIDIGGGSTEFIIGERFEPQEMESLHMGCVSFRNRYFPDGEITARQMDRAVTHAAQELLNIRYRFRQLGWDSCVGTSGSIKAVVSVVEETLRTSSNGGISLDDLKLVRERMLELGRVDRLETIGVREDRQSIFPAGFAILLAAFESLGIERLSFADGALREGLLYDTVGRRRHEDVRERTIQALQTRYHVDAAHAAAVEETAMAAYSQVAIAWGLDGPEFADLLRWACRIHEVGLTISHTQYHKHGAYLIRYSDLPGFSRDAQTTLATLVRGHRRKFSNNIFHAIEDEDEERLRRLSILLRLGVLLQHAHNQEPPPPFRLKPGKRRLEVRFPTGWLDQHPLTRADLENEQDYLSRMDYKLIVGEAD